MNTNQPKPTTGEWTVDRIRKHLADDPIYGYATLARDINAAVKEAYEKGYDDGKQAR